MFSCDALHEETGVWTHLPLLLLHSKLVWDERQLLSDLHPVNATAGTFIPFQFSCSPQLSSPTPPPILCTVQRSVMEAYKPFGAAVKLVPHPKEIE